MTVSNIIKDEFKLRLLDESLIRIQMCLSELTLENIWHKPNTNTNAVGNLVVHLEGNIRQYIISGVGGNLDTRKRDDEFNISHGYTAEKLIDLLSKTLIESNNIVQNLSEDQLIEEVSIQGFNHTRLSAIIHVIEHLSYHTGQITYYTKFLKNIDTGYYAGLDLNITDA